MKAKPNIAIFLSIGAVLCCSLMVVASHQNECSFHFQNLYKRLKFYPNPAISEIHFETNVSTLPQHTVQIYNFMGQLMDEIQLKKNKTTVLLDKYYRGVYIYHFRDSKGKLIESGKFQVIK